jgi:hypothetical protein
MWERTPTCLLHHRHDCGREHICDCRYTRQQSLCGMHYVGRVNMPDSGRPQDWGRGTWAASIEQVILRAIGVGLRTAHRELRIATISNMTIPNTLPPNRSSSSHQPSGLRKMQVRRVSVRCRHAAQGHGRVGWAAGSADRTASPGCLDNSLCLHAPIRTLE